MSEAKDLDLPSIWPLIFDAFDENGDGTVSRQELAKFWKEGGTISNVLAGSDFDKDGKITKKEWTQQYELLIKKFGKPDAGAIKEAKAVLEKIKAKK
eukprot:jgi/Bigna1/59243/fgenesh1_kg.3_\